jgi:hypothetical protein
MTCVVCDTGPILHLAEANASDLLYLSGELHIPPAVDIEMRRYDAMWLGRRPGRIRVAYQKRTSQSSPPHPQARPLRPN